MSSPKWVNVAADWSELVGKTIVYMDVTEGDEQVNFRAKSHLEYYLEEGQYYTIWFTPHKACKCPEYSRTGLTRRELVEV